MIRHLLYSVYATSHSGEWILNISKLTEYASVFTGRKIVIVRSDENTVDPEEVEAAFTFPVEFVHVKNDELQETSYFIENLAKFRFAKDKIDENEILFYAHTKGVKYNVDNNGGIHMIPIRLWRTAMYEANLENIAKIDSLLKEYSCVGSFKMMRGFKNSMPLCKWHYSGNFWWVKLAELFKRPNWTFVYQHTHAIEAYLGAIFSFKEAFNITYTMSDLNRYQLTRTTAKLINIKKDPFIRRTNSRLFCIITGMENSGTTILSRILMSVPGLFGGFECGMLLGDTPKNFKDAYPFFERLPQQVIDLTGTRTVPDDNVIVKYLSWDVNEDGMKDILESGNHMEMYERLHRHSAIIKPSDLIIDKTPRYIYDLQGVIKKTRGEIPIIVVVKSYRELKESRLKRGISMKETVRGFIKAKQGIDKVIKLNQVLVVEYKKLGEKVKDIFSFLGLEWKDEYLSLKGYNEKTAPFNVNPAEPAAFPVHPEEVKQLTPSTNKTERAPKQKRVTKYSKNNNKDKHIKRNYVKRNTGNTNGRLVRTRHVNWTTG